jgi:hypothetical protein
LHVAAHRLSRLTLLGHWQKGKSGRLRRAGRFCLRVASGKLWPQHRKPMSR